MNVTWRNSVGAVGADVCGTQPAAPGCARFVKVFSLLVSLAGLGAWSGGAHAVACTSDQSGNWSQKGTWGVPATGCVGAPGGIPGAADTVTIAVGHTVTMNDNPGSALSLVINGTANWNNARTTNIGAGGITINAGGNITGAVAGVLTSTGGLTLNANLTSTTVTITLQTTAAQTISGTGSLANLTVTGAGVTATNTGTLTVGTALAGTGTLANTGTLNLGGTSLITTLTANAAGNTVNYTGAAQTVKLPSGSTYSNLTLSGSGIKTMPAAAMAVTGNFSMSGTASATAAAALTVGGNFTIGAGTTFTAGAFNHTVSGNWDATGTFNAGTGTVTLNGAVAQTISGTDPVSFYNLTVTNATVPNITLATNVSVTGTLSGAVTLTSTCPIDYTLTSNGGATIQHSCPGPDHILISHAGSALTCSPQIVTITTCANAACTAPHYSGGANVTLTPGGQTFAIDASGINNAASVQQSAAGAVVLDATSVPAATSATPTTCWNTVTSTASCAMTFSDSGFLVTVPDHVSCNNATATIEAVETAPGTGRCVPAYQNVTRAVNLYSSYANPATGTQVVTASTGVVSTAAPGTAHNLAFDVNGTATITLSYPDAGQLVLTAGDTAPTGAAMTGSGSFVAAPASFVFSGIPAAPLTAGQPFNATVTAMNACGVPAATPNFDGTVTITSSNPQPGIGNATAINTTLGGFSNGAASTNLTWDEVGTIDLNANLANYLGSALSVSGTQAGAGRFHPAYFDTVVTQGCSTFTYAGSTAPVKAGQPFTVTVTANKAGGGITANYAGAANAYLTTLSNAGVTAGLANNTIAAASFANGVGSANVTYEVATPQTALLMLALRAIDSDTPAVSSSGYTEGTTEIRSGRARISNAHGSELLALPIPFRAEYWNNGWVPNPADICSGDGLSGGTVSVALSALPATCVQDTGSPGLSGAGCAAAGPAGQRFKEGGIAGFAGNFNLWLKAPGAGNTGAVTVTGMVPAWLQYPWSGGAAINPVARATFGVYKGGDEFIYQRENY